MKTYGQYLISAIYKLSILMKELIPLSEFLLMAIYILLYELTDFLMIGSKRYSNNGET